VFVVFWMPVVHVFWNMLESCPPTSESRPRMVTVTEEAGRMQSPVVVDAAGLVGFVVGFVWSA
jgi:hypothetical protein